MSVEDTLRSIAEALVDGAPDDFDMAVIGDLMVAAEVCTSGGEVGLAILTDVASQDQPRFLSQLLSIATQSDPSMGSGS